MKRQLLEHQANRIELLLASHKIPAQVYGGTVTPQAVRFHVMPALGVRLSRIRALAEEIALVLGADECRVHRHHGTLEVEVPRRDRQTVRLLSLCSQLKGQVPPCTAVLGLDGDGTPLLLRLSSPEVAHVLVAGTTGSGKTALLQTMAVSLALFNRPYQVQLAVLDPKARDWGELPALPHVGWPPVTDPGYAVHLLRDMAEEMERRDRARSFEPHIVLMVDELADLVMAGGESVVELLTRLVQRGRQAGLHVVAATQRPTSAVLGGLMKANFPVRLVGRVLSAQDALVAAGVGGTGAEQLAGRGAFVLVAGGTTIRLQCAYVSEKELGGLAQLARRGEGAADAEGPVLRVARRLRIAT